MLEKRQEGSAEGQPPIRELANMLLVATGEPTVIESDGETQEIDTNSFSLSFVVHDDSFEIRNIDSRVSGVGSKVIGAIHDYCDKHELAVYASNVKSTAHGFWRLMGYEEGENDEFFRI